MRPFGSLSRSFTTCKRTIHVTGGVGRVLSRDLAATVLCIERVATVGEKGLLPIGLFSVLRRKQV